MRIGFCCIGEANVLLKFEHVLKDVSGNIEDYSFYIKQKKMLGSRFLLKVLC